jgi:MerR family transcriptional regulator, light-induced transcriptional regulator
MEEPIYNIGAVARLTNIKATTLRMWERRYGFPQHSRTEGKHRLYSKEEVSRLHWVKARLNEGMRVSQAIRDIQQTDISKSSQNIAFPTTQSTRSGSLETSGDYLTQCLFAHNTDLADQFIAELSVTNPVEDIILHTIVPAFAETGQAWLDEKIDVATEHFATNYLRQRLLLWMQASPPPHTVRPIVLACPPEEWHEGSLLVLGVLLRRKHWPVAYLGQSVPYPDLAKFVHETQSSIVTLVAMTSQSAHTLGEWPQWLGDAVTNDRLSVCFGGYAFTQNSDLIEQTPGIFLGPTIQEGLNTLDNLLREINPFIS